MFSSLLDPACITDDMYDASIMALWTMLDYGMVGSSVSDSPNCSAPLVSNISSPSPWVLGSDIFNTPSLEMADTDPHLFGGLTPYTHFNREVDSLLHPC
jgi:hypothetical protein